VTRPGGSRGNLLREGVSARGLFVVGALLLPAFLLQQDPVVRVLQILLFLGLNAAGGRRIRVLQILIVSAGIVGFNLLIPTGKVLLSILGLPITEVALRSGIAKATAVVGMIAISQFSLRADLRIPGRVGGLIGKSLLYFERIMSKRARIDRKDIIGSIDRLLLEVQGEGADQTGGGGPARATSRAGGLVLGALVAVNWGVLTYTIFRPHPFW
jgi:hypothetical protein